MEFDWDCGNRDHIALHGITTRERSRRAWTLRANGEKRFLVVGETARQRILLVAGTWREARIRVITAYPAVKKFREFYRMKKEEGHGST